MDIKHTQGVDDAPAARDHRARNQSVQQDRSSGHAPGHAPVAPEADGIVATSRPEQRPLAQGDLGNKPQQSARGERKQQEQEHALAKALDLPANTRLSIEVDVKEEQVRFQIFDRDTGKLVREVPEDEAKGLMEKLAEHGASVFDERF